MSDPTNSAGIHVLENILIKCKAESELNNQNTKVGNLKDSNQSGEHTSVKSVHTAGVSVPNDDDDDNDMKMILDIGTVIPQSVVANEAEEQTDNLTEIARKQLEQLNPKKRGRTICTIIDLDSSSTDSVTTGIVNQSNKLDKMQPTETSSPTAITKPPLKILNRSVSNTNISKKDIEKEIVKRFSVPAEKPQKSTIDKSVSAENEKMDENEDLIAILEGKDDQSSLTVEVQGQQGLEVFEVIPIEDSSNEKEGSSSLSVNKEVEKKIALEQMLTIPRGRKFWKRKPIEPVANKVELLGPKLENAARLLNTIVSDWSDDEDEVETIKPIENKIQIKPSPKPENISNVKVEPPAGQFRRTRVIKKKIIWDPDAPETQFSYASLVQTSAKKLPVNKKQQRPITPKKMETNITENKKEPIPAKPKILNAAKRNSATPPIILNKKKKLSEIDRLLGDEGAANMLSALENEKSTPQKESRTKKDVISTTPVKRETISKKKSLKSNSPASASSSWDYVYNQQNVDSMIIRRRSNSSYSSTSPRRLSVDHTPNPLKNKQDGKNKTFEFAKPETKKNKKSNDEDLLDTISVDIKKTETKESIRKSNRTPVHVEKEPPAKLSTNNHINSPEKAATEVILKKHGNITQLICKLKSDKIKNTFSQSLMDEVVNRLETLKCDITCKVVFITTNGPQFCQGIDFSVLTFGNAEKRKSSANELAESVKNFLYAIASFPKPIVAGTNGSCSGIGVTMLPLFDLVIGGDKCTFEIPHLKIGQIVEGNCIISLTNNIHHNFKTRMLWLGEKMNSNDALLAGLITKVTSSSKLQEDLLLICKKIATSSQQALTMMKLLKQKTELEILNQVLKEEQEILVQHWTSVECQEKFKQFIAKESW